MKNIEKPLSVMEATTSFLLRFEIVFSLYF